MNRYGKKCIHFERIYGTGVPVGQWTFLQGHSGHDTVSPIRSEWLFSCIRDGRARQADIDLNFIPAEDAFDVGIPEIQVLYTHMPGHDCHSIVAESQHCDALIAIMQKWREKGTA